MKRIIVTGAQFGNKGAQSLLFCFVSSIREQIPECEILYFPLDVNYPYEKENLKMCVIRNTRLSHQYEAGGVERYYAIFKCFLNRLIKKKGPTFSEMTELSKCLKKADILVDLSGYNLGSKWPIETNKNFLRYFSEAKKHGIPVILFPQSFGPFDYGEKQDEMDALISSTLNSVNIIFAREKEGYDLLTRKYELKNVKLSQDFVLQSELPKWERIFGYEPRMGFKKIQKQNVVGVIPNYQNFLHGNREEVLNIYITLIRELLLVGKNIIIFRHSEDLDVCREIYNVFKDNSNVELYEYDFSSFEYSKFIMEFDFLVAARYHSIIHAYKVGVPAIVLGWAVKYQELVKLCGQEKYLLSTEVAVDSTTIKEVVALMNKNYKIEKNFILKAIASLNSKDCINAVANILK